MSETETLPAERVAIVPVHTIKPSEFALRAVDKTSEKYLELVDSIRNRGVLNPVLVTDVGNGVYGLVDGLHRVSAAKDAGVPNIPILVKPMNEAQMMEAQIITNLHKIETKPMDYTKQLFKLLSADPLMTQSDLADKLNVAAKWLTDRLSLSNLTPEIQELVNENRIGLANAYSLAKLPAEEQPNFVDRAITDAPQMFVPVVAARTKEIREANRKGQAAAPAVFAPVPRLQSKTVALAEKTDFKTGPKVMKEVGAQTAQEGWLAAVTWMLQLDPASVKDQEERYNARQKAATEAKEVAKQEREAKKLADAAKAQADISKL